MGKRLLLIYFGMLCCVGLTQVLDAAEVVVSKKGSWTAPIDLSAFHVDGPTGAAFLGVLRNDLESSGWFRISRPGDPGVTVQGSLSTSGGGLLARVDVQNSAQPGGRYLNQTFSGEHSRMRNLAHAVSDAIVEAVMKRPGIASSRIVMIGSLGGRKDLYMCDTDGHNFMQVTHDRAVCLSPRWGHQGRELVYTSFVRGYPDVYMIDLQSSRRRPLAAFPGLNTGAAISPDGRELALTLSKDGNPDLYVMDIASRRVRRLTKTPSAAEASPTWSPNGREIAFVSDRVKVGRPQVYVIPSAGGQERRITFTGTENVSPDWGRDNLIVCSSRRTGRYQLVLVDPTGAKAEIQLTSEYVDHESPSWARDGRHIAFSKTQGYQSDVYLLDTLGDRQIRLTQLQGDWYSPDCSPN